jgi:hypothetical protein
MQDIQAEINRIDEKLSKLDPTSTMYQHYFSMRSELAKLNKQPVHVLHVEGDALCEGCQ